MLVATKLRVPAIPVRKTQGHGTTGVDTRTQRRVTTDEGMRTDEGMTTSVRTATEARMKTRLTRRRKVMLIAGTTNAPTNKSEV